jgi:signal transduction histidine kinase
LLPLVVALLVAFFGLLLAGHGFASRHEPGMSTFAFAPLGVAGMAFAGLLHGFSPVPQSITTAVALLSAPLSFWGFTLEAWRDPRHTGRTRLVFVTVGITASTWGVVMLTGLTADLMVPAPLVAARLMAFAPPCFVFLSHVSLRARGTEAERRFSTRTAVVIAGSLIVAVAMSLPAILRAPWNLSDPLLWVALAALTAAWVQVSEGRVVVRLFASRALTWLVLFLGLVAVLAAAARQLDIGLDLPRILAGVVATLLLGIGFLVVSEAVSRRVDALFAPQRTQLERELEDARRTVQSMQSKWSHLERLALAGELSAMVAHEIKNPLAALRGWAEMLGDLGPHMASEQRPRFDRALQVIRDESDRINERVTSLLQLARPVLSASDVSTMFSVRQVATEAVALVEGHARPVQITLLAGEPVQVRGNPDGLRTALVNLLRNAADAQREGRISVELTRREGGARLCVTDEGHGLTAEQRATPVVAFRSTKPDGTGLGLVIAQAGVTSCGGALSFEPNLPRGTRAIIDLPSSEVSHG